MVEFVEQIKGVVSSNQGNALSVGQAVILWIAIFIIILSALFFVWYFFLRFNVPVMVFTEYGKGGYYLKQKRARIVLQDGVAKLHIKGSKIEEALQAPTFDKYFIKPTMFGFTKFLIYLQSNDSPQGLMPVSVAHNSPANLVPIEQDVLLWFIASHKANREKYFRATGLQQYLPLMIMGGSMVLAAIVLIFLLHGMEKNMDAIQGVASQLGQTAEILRDVIEKKQVIQ